MVRFSPCSHDERVVDGDADDLIDPLALQFLDTIHPAGQMSFRTTGREGAWDAEYDDAFALKWSDNI